MKAARSRLPESQVQSLLVRIPATGVEEVRQGHVYVDVFSFESDAPVPTGTQLIIQYRVTGTRLWVTSRAVVLGCVPGTSPVVVQGRLVSAVMADQG